MISRIVLLCSIFLFGISGATASPLARSVRLEGRQSATVTTSRITMGDVAEVWSTRPSDDEAVIALRKLDLGISPEPGQRSEISGVQLVESLKRAGVNLESISYRFPRTIAVERASRTLRIDEVQAAIEQYLRRVGKEVDIRNIRLEREIAVAPGEAQFSVLPAASSGGSHMNFDLTVRVPDAPEVRFQGIAQVSEWGEIPVAARGFAKGEVVGAHDITRARVNLSALPREAALDEAHIVGMQLEQGVNSGEFFRRDKLASPPVVSAGQKVVLLFKSTYFEASATGVALETGAVGDPVKVRNDASKRVVSGIAREPGLVEVTSALGERNAR